MQHARGSVPRRTKHSFGRSATTTEAWAILHPHPPSPEVDQQSVTPWLVEAIRDTAGDREIPVHGTDGPASRATPELSSAQPSSQQALDAPWA